MAQRVRQMTGFVPARLSIFKLAFSHKSNQATKDYAQTNNERLEYLGDAVLGTIVAEYLFKKYPNGDEGFLTKMRSKIVKRKSLNYIGDQMGLDVLLSEYNRTRLSSSMLGNAVEALVGAVYLEKGYRATKRFVIQRMLKLYVDMHELETVDDNYKSQLLEYCQKNGMQVTYKLMNKFKQDRRDRFKVAVMVNGEQLSLADDFNKKSAEQLASLRALQKIGLIDKVAPTETGRKSPSKETSKPDRRPKRAKPERKSKSSEVPTIKRKTQVSDEHLAVTAISKRQAEKPKRVKEVKSKEKLVVAKNVKAPVQELKPKHSSATLPARKQRRNNSRLGRAVWHGIQTGGASIEIVEGLGYFEKQATNVKSKPSPKRNKASAKTRSTNAVKERAPRVVNAIPARKAVPTPSRKERLPTASRKRRPIPLRLLTPIVKDASAVMAIDFSDLFDSVAVENRPTRDPRKTTGRKPTRKPAIEKPSQADAGKEIINTDSWEDTPLGLSTEMPSTPKPSTTKKSTSKQEGDVVTEQLDNWEDTLLEITGDGGEVATELPEMYNKSERKAPTHRKRPQRRGTNQKKKTEE